MTYNYDALFAEVDKKLSAKPGLRLYELSRQLECSHPTVERVVLKNTGLSFREYQKSKLMQRTVLLIRQGYKPREIAKSMGYRWPENFMRFVKRHTGCSLGALKKKMGYGPIFHEEAPTKPVDEKVAEKMQAFGANPE
jgi:AraC-like DNA-binding protein